MSEVLDADFQRQILAAFAAEAEERLQAITDHLLALEKKPDAGQAHQLLKDIFREAHTLKGGARVLNLPGIEQVTHRLESLFGLLQNGKLLPRQAIFDLVYQSLDVIALLLREATTGSNTQIDITELCGRLDQAQEDGGEGEKGRWGEGEKGRKGETAETDIPAPSHCLPVSLSPLLPVSPSPAPPPSPSPNPPSSDETVRVAVAKLDALMAEVGELQVARIGADQRLPEVGDLLDLCENWEARWRRFRSESRRHEPIRTAGDRFRRHGLRTSAQTANHSQSLQSFLDLNAGNLRSILTQLASLRSRLKDDSRRMAQVLAELQDDVRRVRMLPIATVFDTFPRMVRDLARDLGKEVVLTIEGGENQMDRSLLEQIKGPLIHLVRNALDHGLETPHARQAAGKAATGSLRLTASQHGGSILIELAEDGAGIDVTRVKASAVQKGWLTPEAAQAMSEREALWLIFRSGLSTKTAVTDLSGRGVGLDVVHEQVSRLNGIIDVDSQPGLGTCFTLRLPLTVATTLSLLVQASEQTFALPITNVLRIARVRPGDIGCAGGSPVIVIDGRPTTLARLSEALGMEAKSPPASGASLTAVVLGVAEKRIAFLVEDVLSTQEIVIKKLPAPMFQVPLIAGVTILGSGEVVMVPNISALLRTPGVSRSLTAATPATPKGPPVILVADDSITTRMLYKNILESACYQVRVAADGQEAWNLLQEGGYDLLISDAEMPRLDGFGLTQKVRGDERWKDLPVILITSLDSADDKERGIRAGADAYVVKNAFDQEKLLAVVGQLI